MTQESINLNKFISATGLCSRREAEKFIQEGRVTINGNHTKLGNRVSQNDVVKLDGRVVNFKPKTLYIAYHKPVGIVSTTDTKEKNNILKEIKHPERLFPIGRLDKPSEGLIFLTNDGDIVNKILRAGNQHEKEYLVTVDKVIDEVFIQKMSNGIPILGTTTKKCRVEKISEKVFKIILVQGLNRQIRRMCEYLNYEVLKLKRTRIMNVELGNLQLGDWRELSENELSEIQKMIATSSKTEEASAEEKLKKVIKPKKKLTSLKDEFNKKSSAFRKSSPKNKQNNSGFSSKLKRRF
ncbi:MAG: 23S rRNA pseudouridine(2604) synthase RluF [Flavobacteriia bacterium]|nr:23S rRNA pseudouridine(2604) synthase RluF [Flavobacteriia bacterium]OIP47248.1 MAG: 23S rRNA pseudouridine synthase F [Flavobacteriaceae bacterium CG2_30_31_66]PIV95987.1 MAG: 23S rRNA pseudouridine(2604) synthase RluF [Flavobacteriaceae bacterium CG17_big_fil_post_rev_8_21_14_2_50_31_13]PIX12129.1 MAG: 23S rRNA pseudouridine(2604) synthase RluF [Flavobacteriaceae bacterium CG_4_8_14_3_um_filter_31_8]PIY14071.1 MAG: 23S rRNA pseudouridine(2604) synthase RluF [Flavobacteriaceae bacterium CG_